MLSLLHTNNDVNYTVHSESMDNLHSVLQNDEAKTELKKVLQINLKETKKEISH